MKQTRAAFSLIELLVVIAIVTIAAAVALIPFDDDRRAKELEANAREVVGTIREAQTYALTGKQLVANTTPCSYEVNWTTTSYRLIYNYKAIGASVCSQSATIYSKDLKKGGVFNAADFFRFSLPHAAPLYQGASVIPVVTVLMGNGSQQHVVCIYSEGRIQDQKGGVCPT